MAFQTEQLHFVLLPLMAQGHMIPMVDIARLLARRGVSVTIVTTPLNAIRFEKIIGRDKETGLQIQMIQLHFPGVEAGLPEGCENLDMLPSINIFSKFFAAASKLQQPMEKLLQELKPQPRCLISDASFWWTSQVAQKFQIPRLVFHGTSCFASVCIENLLKSRVLKNVLSDSEHFVIPDLPHRIELTKAQLPGFVNASISSQRKRFLPAMASQAKQVHFVLFPLMAPGHMIPMVDIGKLLAQRGITITILTTAHNAKSFSKTIARAIESEFQIQFLELHFPCIEAGLPEGCENLDMLPSLDMAGKFFVATSMLRQEVEQTIENLTPKPSCLISDMGFPWTAQIAQKFHIPRFVFHGTCCFSLLCSHNIFVSKILDNVSSDTEYFVVPGLPDRVEVTKAQVSGSQSTKNSNSAAMRDVRDQIREAERTSYGVVVNSFQELEPEYVKEYRKVKGEKVCCIGPVSLCNRDNLDMVERGKQNSIDEKSCLNWLDSHKPRSVVYASLGSLSRLTPSQMMELAFGLEASNRPFMWAFGGGEKSAQLEKFISDDGFEERIKGRGLLIRGWAPQVLILSHQAIGGFLTHCGWNSTLEGISAGIPMVTWPQFAEQFCNEKLIIQILNIGVSLGVSIPVKWGDEEKIEVLVKRDDVKNAIGMLMDEGKEGEERRRRARDLGEKAKAAIEEGGSSYHNMTLLIQDVMKYSS